MNTDIDNFLPVLDDWVQFPSLYPRGEGGAKGRGYECKGGRIIVMPCNIISCRFSELIITQPKSQGGGEGAKMQKAPLPPPK